MFPSVKTLLVFLAVSATVYSQEAEDDGSYHPDKYETPYAYQENAAAQPAQPQYNPQYQSFPQGLPQAIPQSIPQYQQPQPQPIYQQQYQPQPQYQPQVQYKAQPSPINTIPQSATNYAVDGHQRSEQVDPQGNVRGQYSYVDPDGKTITVKYTAGKNGFQVEGEHLPQAPAPGAAPQPIPQGIPQAAPQYQPQAIPQYQPQAIPQYQPQAIPQYQPQAIPQYQAQGIPQLRNSNGLVELPSAVQNFFSTPLRPAYGGQPN